MRALLILCVGCVLLVGCDSPSPSPKPSPYRFAEVGNAPHTTRPIVAGRIPLSRSNNKPRQRERSALPERNFQ
jgi:hypothetical protein